MDRNEEKAVTIKEAFRRVLFSRRRLEEVENILNNLRAEQLNDDSARALDAFSGEVENGAEKLAKLFGIRIGVES